MTEDQAIDRVMQLDNLIEIAKHGGDFIRAGKLSAERKELVTQYPKADPSTLFGNDMDSLVKEIFGK